MKRILAIILMLLTFGCAEDVIEKPEDLLSKEKMVDIIHDIAILQAIKSTNQTVAKEFDSQVMELIYKIHDTDSAQFARSDLYYASIPLQYENIYESVQSRLENEKQKVEEERKKKSDSARKSVRELTDSIKSASGPKLIQENPPEKDDNKDE